MSREEYAKQEPRSRIWFARRGVEKPWPLHEQVPGELVTHECWWVNDALTFCGGYLPEESHLKTASVVSGVIRILGPGRWWPKATSAELAKHNWWHTSGSPDGKWVAADNWHGDIVLFNAKTTEMRPLTAHIRWRCAPSRGLVAQQYEGGVCQQPFRQLGYLYRFPAWGNPLND